MSIIASIITPDFAIIKADTKAIDHSNNDAILVQQKALKLERGDKEILIGYCGAMAFSHKKTIDHIKDHVDMLFDIYDRANGQTDWEMGMYLIEQLKPPFETAVNSGEIASCKNLVLHIVAKSDHNFGKPHICRVVFEYRIPEMTEESYAIARMIGIDDAEKKYKMEPNGANSAQDKLRELYNSMAFDTEDFVSIEGDFENKMKMAIAASSTDCGEPIDTFSYVMKF